MEKLETRVISLNKKWMFKKLPEDSPIEVDVPHNWNSKDGQDGGNDYHRGRCTYFRTIKNDSIYKEKVLLLEFNGVNASADVYFNDELLTHHDGGYSTFRCEIPSRLIKNENTLKVEVDNSVDYRVYPQKADFTFYGGIYRDVNLLVLSPNHFERIKDGNIGAKVDVYLKDGKGVIDVEPYIVGEGNTTITLLDNNKAITTGVTHLEIDNPHLWNGLKDPYLYTLKIELIKDNEIQDQIIKKVGFRSFKVDPKKGFYLNDTLYSLRGVARHQDRKNIGNSLGKDEQIEDIELIKELGANTIRLAHYQHNDYFLDLCDEYGFVVWAEIPYISNHAEEGNENTITQMREIIAQQRHHPSICFWGTSNEITMFKGHQKELVRQNKVLNDLCHELDPYRLTTLACFAMCGPFNKVTKVTDVVSWNLYFGWYTPFLWLNPLWFGFYHLTHRNHAVGLSEYGAEGMINLHSNKPHRGDSTEEYQLKYHEYMCRFISKRPWLWATHVWNMFDFGSDGRNHGGDPGVNHKGLMTFDHKTKKDSFYICKAYWQEEKFVHIAGKRFENRNGKKTTITVITNETEVVISINDKPLKTIKNKKYYQIKVPLTKDIKISVDGINNTHDEFVFKKVDKFDENYKLHTVSNNYSWEK